MISLNPKQISVISHLKERWIIVKDKNKYFAEVFTKLLSDWLKECDIDEYGEPQKRTQLSFINAYKEANNGASLHPNMISRYKKGESFPNDPEALARVFNVDSSVFFPSSFQDRMVYDEDFRKKVYLEIGEEELRILKEYGIDMYFYEAITHTDHFADLFPFEKEPTNQMPMGLLTWFKNRNGENVGLTDNDLLLIKDIQEEIHKTLMLILIRETIRKDDEKKKNEQQ